MINKKLFFIIFTLLFLITALTGCGGGGGSGDGPFIHGISFDPSGEVLPGSDVKVTADVDGTDLEYHWTVQGGILRSVDFHQGQAGPGIPNIAVTPSEHDNAGKMVSGMGFDYDTISLELLGHSGVLSNYDVIFINSSDAISTVGGEIELENWVSGGGALYASGRGADYLIEMGIDSVTFAEPEPYVGSANTLGDYIYGQVVDESMQDGTGIFLVDLQYPDYEWAPILDTGWPATPLMGADASDVIDAGSITNFPPGANLNAIPMAVLIPHGDGEILYTSFHDHPGMSHEEVTLVSYLVARTITWPIIKDSRRLIELTGFYPHWDFLGFINEDSTEEKDFDLEGFDDVMLVINAATGIYEIEITGPGDISESITTPVPISMTFPAVLSGEWTVSLHAVDTGDADIVPYVLSVGVKSATISMITLVPEVIWTVPPVNDIYQIHLEVIDGEFRTHDYLAGVQVWSK